MTETARWHEDDDPEGCGCWLWDGSTDQWHEGVHLERACARAELDFQRLAERVQSAPAELDSLIEGNQRALQAAGHWGVPTFVWNGEPFFGQDRIDLLIWRLKQHGLRERSEVQEP